MSSIKLESNASGTGIFTIASPNSNTNRTLTLPDQTGTVLTGSGAIGVNASAPTNSVAIDSSGNVGIGTSSPLEKLQVAGPVVSTANLAALRASTMTMDYISGGRLIATGADSSTYSPIIFGTATTTTFAERGRFEANGNLKLALNLSVGSATPTTSGTGITFPATQSASTDANTLDDYEEGTWTPNSGGTATYTTQNGTYTKVGNKVTAHFVLQVNTIGTGSASNILGFPFTASSSAGSQSGHMSYATGLSSNQIFIGGYISANSTTFTTTSSGAAANSVTTNNIITSGTLLIGDITYFI